VINLDQSPGLVKTRQNFISLCTGEKGFSKNAPTKRLHYMDCPIHRIVKGFVAQGGDVTRGDGSGGEVQSLRGVSPHGTLLMLATVNIWSQVLV
jgi:cyclophilin family peptidyl-prolyl cis-trans isomerase